MLAKRDYQERYGPVDNGTHPAILGKSYLCNEDIEHARWEIIVRGDEGKILILNGTLDGELQSMSSGLPGKLECIIPYEPKMKRAMLTGFSEELLKALEAITSETHATYEKLLREHKQ